MRIIIASILIHFLFFNVFVNAETKSEVVTFLESFPKRMSCNAVEVYYISDERKILSEKVLISFLDINSNRPQIEVLASSASQGRLKHFKIGNGFNGSLTQTGTYSYYLSSDKNRLYYVPTLKNDDPVSYRDVVKSRGLVSFFSSDRVCIRGHLCLILSNCLANIQE